MAVAVADTFLWDPGLAGSMRIAVISDTHANLPALDAVFGSIERLQVDRVVCAGDIVGYNPWPNEVIRRLRDRGVTCIRGNHDRAALMGDASWFNPHARTAIEWTRRALTPESVSFLRGLEDRTRWTAGDFRVAMYHGSPWDDDEYIFPWEVPADTARYADADVVILGHTHLPMSVPVEDGFVVNPGSVGQPRDGNPRAAVGVLDTDRRRFDVHRIEYDVGEVARAIRAAGLPEPLARRLVAGV